MAHQYWYPGVRSYELTVRNRQGTSTGARSPDDSAGRVARGARAHGENLLQLTNVLLEVSDDEPLDEALDRHLAEARVETSPSPLGGLELGKANPHGGKTGIDPIEQLARGQVPVAPDPIDPLRVRCDPAERDRFR
jgi:hypothetical protein